MSFFGGSWRNEKDESEKRVGTCAHWLDEDQYEDDTVKEDCENCARNSTYNKYYSACIWTPDNPYRCSHYLKIK